MSGRYSRPHHDVWRHGDLGATGWRIYNVLRGEVPRPTTVAAVARMAGVSRSTASRRLKQMQDRGLARKAEGGWWVQGEAEPTEVASSREGKAAQARDRHRWQRHSYRCGRGGEA